MRIGHSIVLVEHAESIETTARRRLRSLRMARGWSIDELARCCHIGPSTISRIETGHRRLAIDHLVALARALDTTVDELLAADDPDDVVIRPTRDTARGATYWLLSGPDDPSGRVVAKMRVTVAKRPPELRVHPGRDWLYVLEGTVRLVLGGREHLVEAGQAAAFDTMTPHAMTGHRAPAEILTIFDRHGERAHLHDD
jgi:transcriptional regulator with XRE-family HTH domain